MNGFHLRLHRTTSRVAKIMAFGFRPRDLHAQSRVFYICDVILRLGQCQITSNKSHFGSLLRVRRIFRTTTTSFFPDYITHPPTLNPHPSSIDSDLPTNFRVHAPPLPPQHRHHPNYGLIPVISVHIVHNRVPI